MTPKYFEGLKVVELASVLAGPAVGLFFAELGAEVIKIENKPTGGDVTRRWKLPGEPVERAFSAYYASVNWGKKTVLLDLYETAAHQEALDLIAQADIVLSNFRPDAAVKLGLDYGTLSMLFPRLIYAQLNGFGEGDSRPAFDVVLQAEAGFLQMTGEPEGNPVKMPVALIDLLAAHQLKEGILLALWLRTQTGQGRLVETSLYEAALASLANQATNWLMGGVIPTRMGTQHPNIAPYGDLFRCADDKLVVLAVGTEKQFHGLCAILGHPEWAVDVRFCTNTVRVQHREALVEALAGRIRTFTREALLEYCAERDVPVGSLRNMEEVFETTMAKQMVVDWTLPDGSPARSVRSIAFRLSS